MPVNKNEDNEKIVALVKRGHTVKCARGMVWECLPCDCGRPKVVRWISPPPSHCDLCHKELEGHFIDGKTVYGPWGCLCIPCHSRYGVGLGVGRGQKYNLKSLEKVEG